MRAPVSPCRERSPRKQLILIVAAPPDGICAASDAQPVQGIMPPRRERRFLHRERTNWQKAYRCLREFPLRVPFRQEALRHSESRPATPARLASGILRFRGQENKSKSGPPLRHAVACDAETGAWEEVSRCDVRTYPGDQALYSGLKYDGKPCFVSRRIPTIASRSARESFLYIGALSFPERMDHSLA